MLYREFGKTGWQISAMGLGCWNIGNQWGALTDEDAAEIIETALDQGMNLFDVAESYGIPNGTSELRLGKALEGRRDGIYIVSKIGHWGKRTGQAVPKTNADMIRLCGHACCGRLRTQWVDVMLCHEGDVDDPAVYIEGFRKLREEGFIREYGISTNKLDVLQRFHEMSDGECAVVEVDYSLVNPSPEAEFLPFCEKADLGVLVRGPLARGLLAGKYDEDTTFTDSVRKSWNRGERNRKDFEQKLSRVKAVEKVVAKEQLVETALRYVISYSKATVGIPGATSPAQVIANAAAGDQELTAEFLQRLRQIQSAGE